MTKMKGLGVTAAVMIGLAGVASLWSAYADYQLGNVFRQLETPEKLNLIGYIVDYANADQLGTLTSLVELCIGVLAAVFFLVWVYRGTANLWKANLPGLRMSPGWSVGWWFIPVVWWIMPLPGVVQLWKGSVHHARGDGDGNWRSESLNPLLLVWWACWVATSLGTGIGTFMIDEDHEASTLILGANLQMVSSLLKVVAAGLAVFIILKVSSLQDAARASMFAAMRGGAGQMARGMMPQPEMAPMGQPMMHPARAPMAGPAGQPVQAPMQRPVYAPMQAPMRAPGQPMMNPAQARQGQPMQPRPGMQPGAPAPRPGVSLPQPRRPMPPGGPR